MIAHIFPTINNVAPYKSKVSTPYFEVQTVDSPYTTNYRGPQTKWYVFDSFSYTPTFSVSYLKWTGSVPIIKFYSGKSYPLEIAANYHDGPQFGIRYIGVLLSDTGSATLYFRGVGRFRYKIGTSTISSFMDLGVDVDTTQAVAVTSIGVGKLVVIDYVSPDRFSGGSNVFSVNYKTANMIKALPLTAGYFQSYADFISPPVTQTLNYVTDLQITEEAQQAKKLIFTVPIVKDTDPFGYKYVKDGDYFVDTAASNKTIKKFRKIALYTGYKYADGSINLVQKFVGQVRSWRISRSSYGNSTAEITCYDWSIFLNDTINEGIPNVSDYLAFGYLEPLGNSSVAGDLKPRTFDGWTLDNAVDCILVNGYIDSSLLVGCRKYVSIDNEIVTGYYTSDEKNSQTPIELDKSRQYGNSLAIDEDQADDKYVWQFSIGSNLSDNLKQLMDSYGFDYGFNNEGNFFINTTKSPVTTKSIDDMSFSGTWTESIKAKCLYAVSNQSTTVGNTVVATYVGTGAALIFDVGPGFATMHIRISNPTLGIVATADYGTAFSMLWSYLDGVSDNSGYNPCMLDLTTGDGYGTYSLNIVHAGPAAASLSVNTLFVYDKNETVPKDTFYSGDTNTNLGNIIDNLDIESDANKIRNDVVVIGRLKGVTSALSIADNIEKPVNPNNPVSDYVIGRSIDRNSIGSISNANYTGRRLQTIIIDPKFATENRALWLAEETARRYNSFSKVISPRLSIIGNPLLEVGDYIQAVDIKNEVVATIHDFWISGISSKYSLVDGFKTSIALDSFEPWESFFNVPTPSLTRLGNTPFFNIRVFNTGVPNQDDEYCTIGNGQRNYTSTAPGTIAAEYCDSNFKNITQSNLYDYIPSVGYIKVGTEIIKYTNRAITEPYKKGYVVEGSGRQYTYATIYFTGLKRGMYNTATLAYTVLHALVGKKMECIISPYIQEEYNTGPGVQFDLMVPGYVRVAVYDEKNVLVDVIPSSSGGAFSLKPGSGEEFLKPGTYYYTWGMIDRLGLHNSANSGSFSYAGGANDIPYVSEQVLDDTGWLDFYGSAVYADTRYKIGQGFYVQNTTHKKYGKFHFVLEYRDPSKHIFNGIKSTSNIRQVNTILRHGGNAVAVSSQPLEQFVFHDNCTFDYTTLPSIWWVSQSQTLNSIDKNFPAANFLNYYTGAENNGNGVKVQLKNRMPVNRIVNLEVAKKAVVIGYKHHFFTNWFSPSDPHECESTYVISVYEDEPTITNGLVIGSSFVSNIYVNVPELPYITNEVLSDFERAKYELHGSRTTKLLEYAITHLHIFIITATDFSGRKHVFTRSIWWIDPSYLNLSIDFAGTPKKLFDGVTTNKAIYGNISKNMSNFNILFVHSLSDAYDYLPVLYVPHGDAETLLRMYGAKDMSPLVIANQIPMISLYRG